MNTKQIAAVEEILALFPSNKRETYRKPVEVAILAAIEKANEQLIKPLVDYIIEGKISKSDEPTIHNVLVLLSRAEKARDIGYREGQQFGWSEGREHERKSRAAHASELSDEFRIRKLLEKKSNIETYPPEENKPKLAHATDDRKQCEMTNEPIASEAAEDFCRWHTHVTNASAQHDLREAFQAAIEKATERNDVEMKAMNDRWERLHKQLGTEPDDDWDEAPFKYIERLQFPEPTQSRAARASESFTVHPVREIGRARASEKFENVKPETVFTHGTASEHTHSFPSDGAGFLTATPARASEKWAGVALEFLKAGNVLDAQISLQACVDAMSHPTEAAAHASEEET